MSQVAKFNAGIDFGILYGKDELLQSCVLMALKNAVGHSQRISRSVLVIRTKQAFLFHTNPASGQAVPGERKIRNVIRDLRRAGALIMSTGGRKGGYWKAESLAEVKEFCLAELESRAKDLFYTASQLEAAALAEFGRQGSMDLDITFVNAKTDSEGNIYFEEVMDEN